MEKAYQIKLCDRVNRANIYSHQLSATNYIEAAQKYIDENEYGFIAIGGSYDLIVTDMHNYIAMTFEIHKT